MNIQKSIEINLLCKYLYIYYIVLLQNIKQKISQIYSLYIQISVICYIIHLMTLNKLVCFLFLVTFILATPFTQDEVAQFVKGNNLVPTTSTISSFTTAQDRSIITFQNENSKFKLIIGKNQQGKPYVVFRQQMTQIKFSNFNMNTNQINSAQPAFILQEPNTMIQMPPMPMIPFGPQRFDHDILSGGLVRKHQNIFKQGKRFGHQPTMPCRINQEQVKELLKENLVIYKNAEIKQIQKVGFERGSGIMLQITLVNENKNYKVTAGYMPRWKSLNVKKIEQLQNTPTIQIPTQPKEKVQSKILEIPENVKRFNFESLLQSFVEKLLVRKDVENAQSKSLPTDLILGSEKQPENPNKLQTPKIPEMPLLGRTGQNPMVAQNQNEKQAPEKQQLVNEEHHKQANSEQISELVTEVISKIKLRTK